MIAKTFADTALCLSGAGKDVVPTSITTLINEYLEDRETKKTISKRFNPSSLFYTCQVERATRIQENDWARYNPNAELSRMGKMGTAIHDALQNGLLAELPGFLWGKWECTCCRKLVWGFRPAPCTSYVISADERDILYCSQYSSWAYKECYFQYKKIDPTNEHYWITGYCDGIWFDEGTGKWHILEMKTKGLDVFSGHRRRKGKTEGVLQEVVAETFRVLPFADQIFQAQLYMPMALDAIEDGRIPSPPGQPGGIIVLNICRDNCLDKFDYMPYDPTHFQSAVAIIEAIRHSETPTTLVKKCPKATSTFAKRCRLAHECFPDDFANPESTNTDDK